MIMMGLHLTGGATAEQRIPFKRLYLHSLVRNADGAKMSKTKGTGVDPLQLTQKYGTDALRYMLASMSAPGTDIVLSDDRILGARSFANKNLECRAISFHQPGKSRSQRVHARGTCCSGNPRESSVPRERRRCTGAPLDFLAPRCRRGASQ